MFQVAPGVADAALRGVHLGQVALGDADQLAAVELLAQSQRLGVARPGLVELAQLPVHQRQALQVDGQAQRPVQAPVQVDRLGDVLKGLGRAPDVAVDHG
jgi:hypothetical protein